MILDEPPKDRKTSNAMPKCVTCKKFKGNTHVYDVYRDLVQTIYDMCQNCTEGCSVLATECPFYEEAEQEHKTPICFKCENFLMHVISPEYCRKDMEWYDYFENCTCAAGGGHTVECNYFKAKEYKQ